MSSAPGSKVRFAWTALAAAVLFVASGLATTGCAPCARELRPAPLAIHRTGREPVLGGGGHSRRHIHLLRGCRVGGIYKTTDAGVHWIDLSTASPSVDRVAGCRRLRPQHRLGGHGRGKDPQPHLGGAGIYKSTDARQTWTLMGLEQTGRIPRLVIDPKNPDTVLACALGHALRAPGGSRRLSHDGRREVVDEDPLRGREHGCSDIAMDPSKPAHPVRRHVAARDSHLGPHERRAGQRAPHVPRRRRERGRS